MVWTTDHNVCLPLPKVYYKLYSTILNSTMCIHYIIMIYSHTEYVPYPILGGSSVEMSLAFSTLSDSFSGCIGDFGVTLPLLLDFSDPLALPRALP